MPKRNTNGPAGGRKASSTGKPFKKTGKKDSERPGARGTGKNFSASSSRTSASKRSSSSDSEKSGKGFFERRSGRGAGKPSREEKPFRKNTRGEEDTRRSGSNRFSEGNEKSFKRPAGRGGSSRFSEGGNDKPFKRSARSGEGDDKPFKRPASRGGSSRFSEGGNDKPFKRSARSGEGDDKPFKRPASRGGSSRFSEGGDDKPFKRGTGSSRFDDNDKKSFKSSRREADNARDEDFNEENDEAPARSTRANSGKGYASKESSKAGSRPRKGNKETTDEPAGDGKIRLNRFIANSGVCSRREADELISMGLISVNGKTITELGYKVSRTDEVRHENKVLRAEKPVYILMNKPKGFLTTTVDPQERNTVMHIIGNAVKERVYPVGRLDRNTTGLLLLTNDGDLADKLMHPSYKAKKIYKVELDRPLSRADFLSITEGVQLEEGKARVDDLAIISEDGKTVGVELHIGWNRVVRRIFESFGYEVVKLDRSVYAGLDKKDLPRGHWRFLKQEEIIRLKHLQ